MTACRDETGTTRQGKPASRARRVPDASPESGFLSQGDPAVKSRGRRRTAGKQAGERKLKTAVERAEREVVDRVLKRADGNVADAAGELGILRTSLYRIMRRFGITPQSRRGDESSR
ncbi:MAG: helix-turn-helix domain-containing protein [bacterium]